MIPQHVPTIHRGVMTWTIVKQQLFRLITGYIIIQKCSTDTIYPLVLHPNSYQNSRKSGFLHPIGVNANWINQLQIALFVYLHLKQVNIHLSPFWSNIAALTNKTLQLHWRKHHYIFILRQHIWLFRQF